MIVNKRKKFAAALKNCVPTKAAHLLFGAACRTIFYPFSMAILLKYSFVYLDCTSNSTTTGSVCKYKC